ncbi:MAG: DUF4294 domain-containing protein [Flavobacteriales bacterium]|jgi:hypothetical protein|nr:DUF4294 domain-containing protein [Flavobacteriales bacterium]
MKLIKNISLVVFVFVGTLSFPQELSIKDYIIEGEDTILLTEVPSIEIISFTDPKEKIKYRILKRRVLKVYPYAIYTKNKLEEIEGNLGGIKRKRKKKRYTKEVAKFLKEELGEKMKKLTKKEGNILVKLIYRETQISSYKLLKQYRGGVNAFFWQTMAILYDNDLKQEYDPENVREDMFIEHIIIQAKLEGKLE